MKSVYWTREGSLTVAKNFNMPFGSELLQESFFSDEISGSRTSKPDSKNIKREMVFLQTRNCIFTDLFLSHGKIKIMYMYIKIFFVIF